MNFFGLWMVWHALFRWEFVYAQNSACAFVRRVRYTAAGTPYIIWFGTNWIWLDEPAGTRIVPLTLRREASA